MHNIKKIRQETDLFIKKLKDRNFTGDVKEILALDIKNRELIQKKELLEKEKKIISQKADKTLFAKSKKISTEIDKIILSQTKVQNQIDTLLSIVPNIALDDVPIGKDENSNKELRVVGSTTDFTFEPKSHFDIGKKFNLIDFDTAVKTSGSRFVFLKGDFARLERAISNFMLDCHTQEFGYKEISPPLIANEKSMFGTGQLPKFENDQFEIKSNDDSRKFLIPTAEVILTNIARETHLDINDLPLRMVASTACFRKEAGSYGKDTKGIIRQHQFYKVELVSIVEPDSSNNELERMTKCAEEILKKLKLPYRVILLSTGDMGFSSEKTYDLEVWIPSEKKYREISSCSSCGQFQSHRMKARFKNKNQKSDFVATLNGSGLAVGRAMVAILENYQQKDGSVIVPDVLIPYMNGLKKIV